MTLIYPFRCFLDSFHHQCYIRQRDQKNKTTVLLPLFFPGLSVFFSIPFLVCIAPHLFGSFHIMIRHRGDLGLFFFFLFVFTLLIGNYHHIIYTFTESIHHIALHYTYTLPPSFPSFKPGYLTTHSFFFSPL